MSLFTFIRGILRGTSSTSTGEAPGSSESDSTRHERESSRATEDPHLARMSRDDFESLIRGYLGFIESLNESGVNYCLVGGLAVLLHAYSAGYKTMRRTYDADLMFDESYTNSAFARAYLKAYSNDPMTGAALYEGLFGDGSFSDLSSPDKALVNTTFVGVDLGPQGASPSFDVVRRLNGLDLKDLESETIAYQGVPIRVATVTQLLEMKRRTVALLTAFPGGAPRLQDVADISLLNDIARGRERGGRTHEDCR